MAEPAKPAFERIRVPNTLKAKVQKTPGGKSLDEMVAAGDLIVEMQAEQFEGLTQADLEVLRGALASLPMVEGADRADVLGALADRFYTIKSQAGTFGRPLLSAVADIGCALLSALRNPARPVDSGKPVLAALGVLVRSLELAHGEGPRPLNATTDPVLLAHLRKLVQACVTDPAG